MRSHKVTRGCGRRVLGGVYLSVPLDKERGTPLDAFLLCPPKPMNAEELRLEPIGVRFIVSHGVTHVVDWVGASHYPNVADMIAEIRRHGASRRISRTADFSRLTPESRLILVHERAIITNADALRNVLRDEEVERRPDATGWAPARACPAKRIEHMAIPIDGEQPEFMCQSLYWEDIEGGEPVLDPAVCWRTVDRTIGDTVYRARRQPDDLKLSYALGAFAMLPIGHISVIHDPEGGRHLAAIERAKRSSLPVVVEEE